MKFRDRHHAGENLGRHLKSLGYDHSFVVIGLPRGGVPVAYRVANILGAPLDLLIVRKLGVPGREELAMGALGPDGYVITNEDVTDTLQIDSQIMNATISEEQRELERRNHLYRADLPPIDVAGKKCLLVDDGIATGYSMRAAIAATKHLRPDFLAVAVPVSSQDAAADIGFMVNDFVSLYRPNPFYGVGLWYRNFPQTSDDEVIALLKRRRLELGPDNLPTAV